MAEFDVNEEANTFSCLYGVSREAVNVLLHRCQESTRGEVEGECAKDACTKCKHGHDLTRLPSHLWWHDFSDPLHRSYCHASQIHERRRKREEQDAPPSR